MSAFIKCHPERREAKPSVVEGPCASAAKRKVPRLRMSFAPRSSCSARDDKNKNLLHKPAGVFSGGAADGQAIDFYGRNADAYGDGLAIFAAGADAFVELQVVADH